ncbi:MAG: Nramp family divalent metal transporter [Acidobacteria bacterium]|nr:Nramp family divalent metal transporter [Acidobacteriota bacterium]
MLVAATGVGAGDLLTASMAGSRVGTGILWAAAAGALLKWTLNEGIARWQMATDTTLMEGWVARLGRWIQWVFMSYFLLWTLMVAGALINACGLAGAGLLPIGDANTSRIFWGIFHSLLGLGLVWAGGFALFEKVMSFCIAAMFVGVLMTAILLQPDWKAVARGLFLPTIPPGGLPWTLGVMGGVGGTVTLLSYGYWIREKGRSGESGMKLCRVDLAVAYAMTALFGIAMVLIGSRITIESQGARMGVQLAGELGNVLGSAGKWMFLVGFWAAVFSSLLGVWQSAPYLFADFVRLRKRQQSNTALSRTRAYREYLIATAVVPMILLWLSVERIQLANAVMGAMFMPLLALTLLIMNNQERWVEKQFRSGWFANMVLVVIVLLFAYMGILQLTRQMPSFGS